VNSGLVIGDRVIIGSESAEIYGIDLATGEERWRVDGGAAGQDAWPYVAIEYGGVAVLMRINGKLQAHDPSSGSLVWSRELTQGGTTLVGPVRCGNWICVSSGRFWVVGPGGGIEWAYGGGSTGDVFLGEPAVDSAGDVFVGLAQGTRGSLIRFTPPVRIGATP
jgi:outer membrane protein assembly factor BamB